MRIRQVLTSMAMALLAVQGGVVLVAAAAPRPVGTAASPLPSAPRTAPIPVTSSGIAGTWYGTYTCEQGLTGLELDIVSVSGDTLTATFNFYAVPSNPTVPTGSYTMTGSFTGSQVTLTPTQWIVQPSGYVLVGLTGTLGSGGTTFSGMVTNSSCGAFSLKQGEPSGYDLVGSDGGVFVFPTSADFGFYGSLPGLTITVHNIVGMVPTVTGTGYFLVGSDGGVFAFGNAPFLGSLPGKKVTPSQPITGIVAADTDKGYFLVGKDGGVFAFGTVPFLGSLPGIGTSVDNIIGIAATPTGDGYWLVSATGTVYAFGAAKQLGTAKGTPSPVSAIAGAPTGGGYWITTQNGAIRAFGTALPFGTLPRLGVTPSHPVIGIVHTQGTGGYWLLGSDGGIFAFGDAPFDGSLPGLKINVTNIVGAVPT